MKIIRLHEVLSLLMMEDCEAEVRVGHGPLYIGGSKESMKAEDRTRLEELGVFWSEECGCWQLFI